MLEARLAQAAGKEFPSLEKGNENTDVFQF